MSKIRGAKNRKPKNRTITECYYSHNSNAITRGWKALSKEEWEK